MQKITMRFEDQPPTLEKQPEKQRQQQQSEKEQMQLQRQQMAAAAGWLNLDMSKILYLDFFKF